LTEIDVKARMLPANTDDVPRVAELPICQNTLHAVDRGRTGVRYRRVARTAKLSAVPRPTADCAADAPLTIIPIATPQSDGQ
jgi:hypothetical protein